MPGPDLADLEGGELIDKVSVQKDTDVSSTDNHMSEIEIEQVPDAEIVEASASAELAEIPKKKFPPLSTYALTVKVQDILMASVIVIPVYAFFHLYLQFHETNYVAYIAIRMVVFPTFGIAVSISTILRFARVSGPRTLLPAALFAITRSFLEWFLFRLTGTKALGMAVTSFMFLPLFIGIGCLPTPYAIKKLAMIAGCGTSVVAIMLVAFISVMTTVMKYNQFIGAVLPQIIKVSFTETLVMFADFAWTRWYAAPLPGKMQALGVGIVVTVSEAYGICAALICLTSGEYPWPTFCASCMSLLVCEMFSRLKLYRWFTRSQCPFSGPACIVRAAKLTSNYAWMPIVMPFLVLGAAYKSQLVNLQTQKVLRLDAWEPFVVVTVWTCVQSLVDVLYVTSQRYLDPHAGETFFAAVRRLQNPSEHVSINGVRFQDGEETVETNPRDLDYDFGRFSVRAEVIYIFMQFYFIYVIFTNFMQAIFGECDLRWEGGQGDSCQYKPAKWVGGDRP